MKLTCEKNKLTEAVSKVQIATSSSSRRHLKEYFLNARTDTLPLRDTTLKWA